MPLVTNSSLKKHFKNKTILVTGGTGSFGQLIVREMLNLPVKKVIIFSRDEQKQFEMKIALEEFTSKLDFVIGDVRDEDSLVSASSGVDIIYHCAALKQVPTCEDFPVEAIKTNTLAALSLTKAAKINKVPKIVLISTDKAVRPVNVMGMTKALQEKILLSNRMNFGSVFVCVRFGNVVGSRGSVVPLFKERIEKKKPLYITDKSMTRFLITLHEAADLVFKATLDGKHGQIYIRKAPACRIWDLAQVMIEELSWDEDYPIKIIGLRPGEQLHESLVSEDEMKRVFVGKDYLLVKPHWVIENKTIKGHFTDYSSETVGKYMNHQEIKKQLQEAGWL